jgi:hypothetical protein
MNAEARAKRFTELREELGDSHDVILSIIGRLPIPMTPPSIRRATTDQEAITAIRALSLAWQLAATEPVGYLLAGYVQSMITDWLTAYELAVACAESGPALWRLNGIDAALGRVRATAPLAEEQLAMELGGR